MNEYILSPKSFDEFVGRVLTEERYFWSDRTLKFLNELNESSHKRIRKVASGTTYFRARLNPEGTVPLSKMDMKPKLDQKSEGRVNPYNINVLYLANRKEIAIAETRAENRKPVTVASFITNRELKLIDCTLDRPGFSWWFFRNSPKTKEAAEIYTWIEIGGAFSVPLESLLTRHLYIPTQILAEFFKHKGYDGIIYQSQFDARINKSEKHDSISENIALFNLNDADAVSAEIWVVKNKIIEVSQESGSEVSYE
jgi:RES domain